MHYIMLYYSVYPTTSYKTVIYKKKSPRFNFKMEMYNVTLQSAHILRWKDHEILQFLFLQNVNRLHAIFSPTRTFSIISTCKFLLITTYFIKFDQIYFTKCSFKYILADLFLFSYEAEFIQKLLHDKKDILLSPSILHFDMFYILTIYSTHNPNELEIKDTTACFTSASHLCNVYHWNWILRAN
jgi:hypothetical protein